MSDFARQFHTPPRTFAPVPFWFWNGDLREEELLRQLRELKAQGCGGFFLHPRHGQRVPYLSEHWFQLVRLVVDEAARLGLPVWLYDEENWPSGTVGGRLTRERPDLRGRYLKFYELPGDAEFKLPEREKLVYAVALPVPDADEHWNLTRAVDVTAQIPNPKSQIPNPKSSTLNPQPLTNHRLFIFTEVEDGYVDLMNLAVAQEFLHMTHEAYAAACGEHFGKTVVGIFTDEPTLVSVWEVREERWLPWSPLLPDEFQREHGYDLVPFLPSLLLDTGASATKVRQDFWQTVRRLYVSNFFQPMAAWCAEHGLALTGHVLHEEPLFRQVRFQGDALNIYRTMHVPGVDHLGVKVGGLHHKLCASVAHQRVRSQDVRSQARSETECRQETTALHCVPCMTTNETALHSETECRQETTTLHCVPCATTNEVRSQARNAVECRSDATSLRCGRPDLSGRADYKRVLSEMFGACGWGVPLAQRRAALDWQLAMGVNLVVPHAAYYSIHGKRKRESPPSEFHEPYWRCYQYFSDYVARLCWALTLGRHVAKVCVLYPLRSAWAHYHPLRQDVLFDAIEQDLFYVCDMLTRLHYDYDFIDEDTLVDAAIEEGRLVVGDERYEMLVLPSVTTLSWAAWNKTKAFYQSAGRVAALGLLPRESERGADEELAKDVNATSLVDLEYVYSCYQRPAEGERVIESYPIFREDRSGGRFCSYQPSLNTDQDDAKLRVHQILRESVTPDVDTRNEWIIYHHRVVNPFERWNVQTLERSNDIHLYFFVNTSDEAQRANLRLAVRGAPEWWDAETGSVTPLHLYTWIEDEEATMVLPLEFAPHESLLIAIRSEERLHVNTTNVDIERITELSRDRTPPPAPPARGGESENVAPLPLREGLGEGSPSRDSEGAVLIEGYVAEEKTPFAEMRYQDEPLWLQGERTPPLPPLDLSEGWTMQPEDDNVLVLPEWEFWRGRHAPSRFGGRLKSLLRKEEWETLPPRERITPRPRLEPMERDLPPMVTYRTKFEVEEIRPQGDRLLWVMEPLDAPFEVYVNRQPLMLGNWEIGKLGNGLPYADAQSLWVDIARLVRVGENTITLIADYRQAVVTPPDHLHRITCDLVPERARLVGDFQVLSDAKIQAGRSPLHPRTLASATSSPLHAWTAQGYPHYSGTMVYRRTFALPPEYAEKKLVLEVERAADVLKLEINRQLAGVRLWEPFRFDVSRLLREGENALALHVTNTAANALLGKEQPSGLLGEVRLTAYHRIALTV